MGREREREREREIQWKPNCCACYKQNSKIKVNCENVILSNEDLKKRNERENTKEENGECEKGIEKETKNDKDRQKKKYSVLLNRKGVSMCVS